MAKNLSKGDDPNPLHLEELVDLIFANQVAVIIGPELSMIRSEEESINLYDDAILEVTKTLAKKYNKDLDEKEKWNFKELAVFLEAKKDKKAIKDLIKPKIDEADFSYLNKLAEMKIDTFISVTPDSWLTQSLINIRGSDQIQEFHYTKNGKSQPPDGFELKSEDTVILNLMGSINSEYCVYSNNDILDWLYTFYQSSLDESKQSETESHPVLEAMLKRISGKTNLLFIGCNLPDWLFLLLCRVLNNDNIMSESFYNRVVHNSLISNPKISSTLKCMKATIYLDQSYCTTSTDFVDRLYIQWIKKKASKQLINKEIFLSFSSKDRDSIQLVNEYLTEIKGMPNVFYDDKKIDPGNDFEVRISKAMKEVKLFVIFLSKNTTEGAKDAYFPIEWQIARYEKDTRDDIEIILISIDSTSFPDLKKNLPDKFKTLSIKPIKKEDRKFEEKIYYMIYDQLNVKK